MREPELKISDEKDSDNPFRMILMGVITIVVCLMVFRFMTGPFSWDQILGDKKPKNGASAQILRYYSEVDGSLAMPNATVYYTENGKTRIYNGRVIVKQEREDLWFIQIRQEQEVINEEGKSVPKTFNVVDLEVETKIEDAYYFDPENLQSVR